MGHTIKRRRSSCWCVLRGSFNGYNNSTFNFESASVLYVSSSNFRFCILHAHPRSSTTNFLFNEHVFNYSVVEVAGESYRYGAEHGRNYHYADVEGFLVGDL